MPGVNDLQLVFTGADLNTENLPLDVISRIRPCRKCRQDCRAVKFDFHSRTLYHDYVKSKAYTRPDIVCFFNPGLYRKTAANGQDTWPPTIWAAVDQNCPILVTAYTEFEMPYDLDAIIDVADHIKFVQMPAKNPFASIKPERNFLSEEMQSLIFKNYYYFVVK